MNVEVEAPKLQVSIYWTSCFVTPAGHVTHWDKELNVIGPKSENELEPLANDACVSQCATRGIKKEEY